MMIQGRNRLIRTTMLCLAGMALLSATACRSINIRPLAGRDSGGPAVGKDQLVALVNRNVMGPEGGTRLKSWQCRQAKFQKAPIPVAADGMLIVEAPHNFRLRVSHPIGGGDELDVGSNQNEFWIWQKDMGAVLTAQHQDLPLALQHFRIPFQPDWIMEVMGVTPIDGSQYELRTPPGQRQAELVSNGRSPTGEPIRKIIRIDTRRGWVLGHELLADNGKTIARAEFSQHEADPESRTVIPRKIRIHWPDADMDLRISLLHVEVNPPKLPEMVWQLPQKNGSARVDMGEYARRQSGVSGILPVDHGVPGDLRPKAPPGNALSPRAELPQQSAAAEFVDPDTGTRPFPGLPPATGAAPPAFQSGDSAPLSPPGRTRLSDIGS